MEVDEPTLRSYVMRIYSDVRPNFLVCHMHDFLTGFWRLYRTILMTYKHKTHAVDSDGKITSNADVNFYIDDVSVD